MGHIWLRSETKSFEKRTPLLPWHAGLLVKSGYQVSVEHSDNRIYRDQLYLDEGCQLVSAGSWVDAPDDAYILGIKALPESDFPLKHHHVYFAHVYKDQPGAAAILNRFKKGKGVLLDMEYLVDFKNTQLVTKAAGYWAGICGAGVTLLLWHQQQSGIKLPYRIPEFYSSFEKLQKEVSRLLLKIKKPKVLVIGPNGMTGRGVRYFLKCAGIHSDTWRRQDTSQPGPFEKILDYDILFNCIMLEKETAVFLTSELLEKNKKLSLVADISCDPDSPYNPLPIYERVTTFAEPTERAIGGKFPVDVMAIDNVTTFLPEESSRALAGQIFPYLCQLLIMKGHFEDSPWQHVVNEFYRHLC